MRDDRPHTRPSTDEALAAALTGLLPHLETRDRAALLRALFPVPSAQRGPATVDVLRLAVARALAEGALRERVGPFLDTHPEIARRLASPARPRVAPLVETAVWCALIVLVALFTSAVWRSPAQRTVRTAPYGALTTEQQPQPPVLEALVSARPHHTARPQRHAAASRQAVNWRTAPTTDRPPTPPATATPFHNIDFSSYFTHVRRHARVASRATPRPTPTPTPVSRPRVHSLFGRWFGPRVP